MVSTDMDVCLWLTLKLNKEWSSSEVSSLFTPETLADITTKFHRLDSPIKMRTLITFLSMDKQAIETSKSTISEILVAAEQDTDEWVRCVSGLVRLWLFGSKGSDRGFLEKRLENAIATFLENAEKNIKKQLTTDDLLPLESPFLAKSLQPQVQLPTNAHFVIREEETESEKTSTDKRGISSKLTNRPLITRPVVEGSLTGTMPSQRSSFSRRSLEPRRHHDSSRYKRHRSKISMIDINEVKQISSQKAQKAEEEQKKKAAVTTKQPTPPPPQSAGPTEPNLQELGQFPASVFPPPPMELTTNLHSTADQTSNEQNATQFPPGFGAPPSYWK